jgi:hypothetical protein
MLEVQQPARPILLLVFVLVLFWLLQDVWRRLCTCSAMHHGPIEETGHVHDPPQSHLHSTEPDQAGIMMLISINIVALKQ